mgnify:CR=1 FL=1
MQKQNTQVRADLERESANRITLEATIEQKDDLIRTLRGSGTTYTNGASSSLRVCTVCTCSALKEVYHSLVYSMNFIGVLHRCDISTCVFKLWSWQTNHSRFRRCLGVFIFFFQYLNTIFVPCMLDSLCIVQCIHVSMHINKQKIQYDILIALIHFTATSCFLVNNTREYLICDLNNL